MLNKFLQWYRDTQASQACLNKWAEVSDELRVAFYRHVEGCGSNKFADKMAARFFRLYREGKTIGR